MMRFVLKFMAKGYLAASYRECRAYERRSWFDKPRDSDGCSQLLSIFTICKGESVDEDPFFVCTVSVNYERESMCLSHLRFLFQP